MTPLIMMPCPDGVPWCTAHDGPADVDEGTQHSRPEQILLVSGGATDRYDRADVTASVFTAEVAGLRRVVETAVRLDFGRDARWSAGFGAEAPALFETVMEPAEAERLGWALIEAAAHTRLL